MTICQSRDTLLDMQMGGHGQVILKPLAIRMPRTILPECEFNIVVVVVPFLFSFFK